MNIKLKVKKEIFNEAYYKSLYDYQNRYEIYYGGAGSGKSVFITQKLIIKLLSTPRKLLVIRKVGRTLKDSVYQLFLDLLSEWRIKPYIGVNKTDFTIMFPNGSVILFKGLDDPEKIKSITGITDIWIEEATEITVDDFSQLDLRLRAKKANLQIYLSFNPTSKANWVYKTWFENPSEEPNTKILKTTYKDNKFLTESYIKTLEAMIKTNPTYYKIYALGEFCSLDKLIYNNWEARELNVGDLKKDDKLKTLIGLDFGFTNDPTALITALFDEENKIIYVIDEHVQTGLTNDKIAEIIKYKGLAKSTIIADAAESKSIKEIKDSGIMRIKECVKGGGSILQGIQRLQQYKIIVNKNCENTITELENYSWKKDKQTNEYVNEPTDKFNHCLDALRYSLQCMEQNTVKLFSKTLLGL